MFKKENFAFGAILGLIAPVIGLVIFKYSKFSSFSFKETFLYMYLEPGHKTLSVALSLSLLLNALLFTLFLNTNKDKTAKGVFITTVVFGVFILLLKTFG